jgi:hypothetical protein
VRVRHFGNHRRTTVLLLGTRIIAADDGPRQLLGFAFGFVSCIPPTCSSTVIGIRVCT